MLKSVSDQCSKVQKFRSVLKSSKVQIGAQKFKSSDQCSKVQKFRAVLKSVSDHTIAETCFTVNLILQAGSVDKNTRPEKKKSKSLKKKRPSIFKKKKEKIDE